MYFISSGTNDYFYPDPANPQDIPTSMANVNTVIGNITQAVTRLSSAGAKNFLVVGIADYNNIPLALEGDFANNPIYSHLQHPDALAFDTLAETHNNKLQDALNQLSTTLSIDTFFFDLDKELNAILANSAALGFTNTTQGCFNADIINLTPDASLCSNPDEYVFFDKSHPTAATHQILVQSAAETINTINKSQAVPEPLTILGVGTAISFGTSLKRKLATNGKNT